MSGELTVTDSYKFPKSIVTEQKPNPPSVQGKSLLGRGISLLNCAGSATIGTAAAIFSTASLATYVALRVFTALAMITIIGIPIAIIFWVAAELNWMATSATANFAWDLFKHSGNQLINTFSR